MRRRAGLAGAAAVVAGAAVPACLVPSTPAEAAIRGVSVNIVQLPDELVAGGPPARLTVVASRKGGGNCFKIRWSAVLRLEGVRADQLRVDRVEDGPFPVDVREVDDGGTRVTDLRFDPGSLCRNRTVTARYELTVAEGATTGVLTVRTEAYAVDRRLLDSDEATRDVLGAAAPATPPATPPAEPTDESPAPPGPAAGAGSGAGGPDLDQAAAEQAEGIPVTPFLLGGLMVFVGLILLVNLRRRRDDPEYGYDAPLPGRRAPRYADRRRRSPAAGG